jgi:hypothetical protein
MVEYDVVELVELYIGGFASGIILSSLALVVGCVINIPFNLMKGGT